MKKLWIAAFVYAVVVSPASAQEMYKKINEPLSMPSDLGKEDKKNTVNAAASNLPGTKPAESAEECIKWLAIHTNYTIPGETYDAVKNEFDGRMHRVREFIKSQNISKFQIENLTIAIRREAGNSVQYALNPKAASEQGPKYKLSGNADFQVDSSESAFKLGQFLTQEKFEVTVSNKEIPTPACNKPQVTPSPLQQKPAATPSNPVPASTPPQAGK